MFVSTTGLNQVFPERSWKNRLSICTMNVGIALPSDIANSCKNHDERLRITDPG